MSLPQEVLENNLSRQEQLDVSGQKLALDPPEDMPFLDPEDATYGYLSGIEFSIELTPAKTAFEGFPFFLPDETPDTLPNLTEVQDALFFAAKDAHHPSWDQGQIRRFLWTFDHMFEVSPAFDRLSMLERLQTETCHEWASDIATMAVHIFFTSEDWPSDMQSHPDLIDDMRNGDEDSLWIAHGKYLFRCRVMSGGPQDVFYNQEWVSRRRRGARPRLVK